MPLTVRTNGSGGSNIITASWFNDFYNLFTGSMQDQEVNFKNLLILSAIGAAPSSALTATVVPGSGVDIGLHLYEYTYANADGETLPSPTASATTSTGNQQVNLTAVTVGPTGTTKRNIYRTPAGGGTVFKFLASINDNTTTTFTDTTPDASLGATAPTQPTFGGSLLVRDSTGATNLTIASNGTIITNTNGLVIAGSGTCGGGGGTGSATWFTPVWGGVKIGFLKLVSYCSSNNASFPFPSNLARGLYWAGDFGGTGPSAAWQLNGVNSSTAIISGLQVGGGTTGSANTFHQNSFGTIKTTISSLLLNTTSGTTVDSGIFIIGV